MFIMKYRKAGKFIPANVSCFIFGKNILIFILGLQEYRMKKIILASASPRRLALLKLMGLECIVQPSHMEEIIEESLSPEEQVMELAAQKAASVAAQRERDEVIIGADTVVVKQGILGKPRDDREAFRMLSGLQGDWHEVITGICVIDNSSGKVMKAFEKTKVKMRPLTDAQLEAYIRTGEPADKAGAYGIQGKGALLVERIEGCYYNVVGLPVAMLSVLLEDVGIPVL